MNTPNSAPSIAALQYCIGNKMLGDLPPSSSVTRFTVSAASFTMILPTAAEPVKAILFTSGCLTRGEPQVSPNPVITFTTPFGSPTSSNHFASSSAVSGVCSAGLSTQVQPAASAGASFQAAIING